MTINKHLLRVLIPALIFAAAVSASSSPDRPVRDARSELEFRRIISRVREQLPDTPLLIKGRLLYTQRVGRPEHICDVEVLLLPGRDPPKARYTITGIAGRPVKRMTIERRPDSDAEIHYETGIPLESAPAPSLYEAIMETGITWNDLTLSFLWRTDGRIHGRESVRGRDCIVVELDRGDQPGTTRLWIDENLFMIIQAEEYNADGERVRRLSIKNIRKIGDTWMIKDMEIRMYPSLDRTLLRIDDMSIQLPEKTSEAP